MVRRYLVAAALLLALAAPVTAQSVKAGIEAWQRADYAGAVAIWRPLAESGDADAAFNLGQAYRLGRGVPTNLAIAKSWFERAARQGHVDAQTTLGLAAVPERRPGRGPEMAQGRRRAGRSRGRCWSTAPRLFNGDGVTQDPVLGYAYVSRAAAQGLAPAKETLAQLDKLMPLDQRKKGVAIAMTKAKTAPRRPKRRSRASRSQVATAKPPPAPAPKPHRRPPSLRRRPPAAQPPRRAPGGSSSAPSRSAARPKRCISKLSGKPRSGRAAALLYPGRRGDPPPGRAVRKQGRAAAQRGLQCALGADRPASPVAGRR